VREHVERLDARLDREQRVRGVTRERLGAAEAVVGVQDTADERALARLQVLRLHPRARERFQRALDRHVVDRARGFEHEPRLVVEQEARDALVPRAPQRQ
jgi:hypothetical protein